MSRTTPVHQVPRTRKNGFKLLTIDEQFGVKFAFIRIFFLFHLDRRRQNIRNKSLRRLCPEGDKRQRTSRTTSTTVVTITITRTHINNTAGSLQEIQ